MVKFFSVLFLVFLLHDSSWVEAGDRNIADEYHRSDAERPQSTCLWSMGGPFIWDYADQLADDPLKEHIQEIKRIQIDLFGHGLLLPVTWGFKGKRLNLRTYSANLAGSSVPLPTPLDKVIVVPEWYADLVRDLCVEGTECLSVLVSRLEVIRKIYDWMNIEGRGSSLYTSSKTRKGQPSLGSVGGGYDENIDRALQRVLFSGYSIRFTSIPVSRESDSRDKILNISITELEKLMRGSEDFGEGLWKALVSIIKQ